MEHVFLEKKNTSYGSSQELYGHSFHKSSIVIFDSDLIVPEILHSDLIASKILEV